MERQSIFVHNRPQDMQHTVKNVLGTALDPENCWWRNADKCHHIKARTKPILVENHSEVCGRGSV